MNVRWILQIFNFIDLPLLKTGKNLFGLGAIHLLCSQRGGGGVEKIDQNANAVREVA